jgi:tRNA A-37 threonylcarbamoyl transferase component Bud32
MSNAAELQRLRDAGRQPELPFEIALPDGSWLTFVHLLRLLPGRRLAGVAVWNGQKLFAKLFVGKDAVRHGERERAGLLALQRAALPTPAVHFAGAIADGGYLVLSDYLEDAAALDQQPLSPDNVQALLPAMALLGRLHAAGLVHGDLHPGNFLRLGEHLLLIDGDGVRTGASVAAQGDNLALFLAQLTPAWDEFWNDLLPAYGRPVDALNLAVAVQTARQGRLRHFLAKTVRDCSQFAVSQDFRRFTVVLRDEQSVLQSLLADPDAAMRAGRLLKDGGTCTVAAVEVAGRTLVVKRYNLKHWRHAVSRAWRPSRAWHSWQAAHRLAFYGIATPKPLALIEERAGPLRGRAFLITEYCPGGNLLELLDPDQLPAPEKQLALQRLFATLHRLKITHGDMKATNLLWFDGQIVLIDLDALVEHYADRTFLRAWRRDRERLSRNWPKNSAIVSCILNLLPIS